MRDGIRNSKSNTTTNKPKNQGLCSTTSLFHQQQPVISINQKVSQCNNGASIITPMLSQRSNLLCMHATAAWMSDACKAMRRESSSEPTAKPFSKLHPWHTCALMLHFNANLHSLSFCPFHASVIINACRQLNNQDTRNKHPVTTPMEEKHRIILLPVAKLGLTIDVLNNQY